MTKINWKEFLSRKKKSITEDDWLCAELQSGSWPFCYIGENKERLSKLNIVISAFRKGNIELFNLGMDFDNMITDRNLPAAKKVVTKIDKIMDRLEAKQRKEKG